MASSTGQAAESASLPPRRKKQGISARLGHGGIVLICDSPQLAVNSPVTRRAGEPFMLVVMQSHATEEQIREVCKRIESLGLKAHPMPGSIRTAIGITGNKG